MDERTSSFVNGNSWTSKIARLISYTVPLTIAIASFVGTHISSEKTVSRHGFVLTESRFFPEHNFTANLYVHEKYGCPFLDINTTDKHNFFAVTFRTTCTDDTGATHVLEHMSLGGSKNFPIRSIFSELHKRSMAVFMNALASIEWTAYPFSTTNEKDFHNLLDVYMDAVFNPLLDETTFEYECRHLEFEVFDDPNTSLKHSGVAYNEMNGVFSHPSERFSSLARGCLYPDSVF